MKFERKIGDFDPKRFPPGKDPFEEVSGKDPPSPLETAGEIAGYAVVGILLGAILRLLLGL